MVETIISVLVGAAITWLVSKHYYKRAGNELKTETEKLKNLTEMILRWLEVDGNNIKVIRDSSGKPANLARIVEPAESVGVSACITSFVHKSGEEDSRT